MEKITLYRPVGLKELQLIVESDFKAFPPRLEWQPIFYPVMNEEYACEIALKWNTKDEFSGYCGFVTAFNMSKNFLEKYEIQNVGGAIHNEMWVPAEELQEFNLNIIEGIKITKTFVGIEFTSPKNEVINKLIAKTIVK